MKDNNSQNGSTRNGEPRARLFRVSYVDTIVREAFVEARDEEEAQEIVTAQTLDGQHHHAIDVDVIDMQAEQVTEIGDRPSCFECGDCGDKRSVAAPAAFDSDDDLRSGNA